MIEEYTVNIGKLRFLLAGSDSQKILKKFAFKSAEIIASNIEKKIWNKYDSDYGLKVNILNILNVRRGSWLVELSVSFNFWATTTAIYEFIKEYESIRKGIILISKDIRSLEISGRRWFKKEKFVIHIDARKLSLIEKEEINNIFRRWT